MATQRTSGPPSSSPLDDPRITAFALGELPEADRAALAADLARDPSLEAEVGAVRAIADDLAVAFFIESAAPVGGLTERQREHVRAAAGTSRWLPLRRVVRWPLYATAASVLLLVFYSMAGRSIGTWLCAMKAWRAGGDFSMESYQCETGSDSVADRLSSAPEAAPMAEFAGASPEEAVVVQSYATPGLAYDISLTATSLAPDLGTPPAPGAPAADPNRKIIKDATLALEVNDVTAALSRIDTLAVQSGGYVLETLTDQGAESGRPGATVKFAVPVGSFEAALGRLRAIGTVAHEQSSGVDVTTEFTDIQSRVANLEATQARVREFLAQAKSVEEALQVNARLTEIEGQLAELKGRSTYLAGRAAYSTITVTLIGPVLPTRTPTITPTPTATPTPTPGTPWSPVPIAKDAFATLSGLLKGLAAVAIWLVVVGLPLGLIAAAGWWGVRGLLRRGQ